MFISIIIVTMIACLLQAALMNYFLYKTCEYREKSSISWAVLIFSGGMEAAVIFFLLSSHYFILPFLLALIFILYTNILYKDKILRNVFVFIILSVYFTLRSVVEFLFSALKNLAYNQGNLTQGTFGTETDLQNYALLCTQILSLFIVVLVILHFMNKVRLRNFWLGFTVPTIVLLSIISIMVLTVSTKIELITCLCLTILIAAFLLLTTLAYVLMYKLDKEEKIKIKEALLIQKEQLIEQNLNEMQAVYNKNQSLRHDLKNANAAVVALIESGNLQKAKSMLLENEKITSENRMVYSKDQALNLLLNMKLSALHTLGVDVKLEIMTDLTFIASKDLCVIFGNLLDNIYDYYKTEGHKEKFASVKAYESQGNVIIEIKNRIFSTVLGVNPELKTKKDKSDRHGIGVESVKSKISTYSGVMDIHEENELFIVTIMIPKVGL